MSLYILVHAFDISSRNHLKRKEAVIRATSGDVGTVPDQPQLVWRDCTGTATGRRHWG